MEYQSLSEWTSVVDRLCKQRMGKSLFELNVPVLFQEAWEEGVTPEEFYEVDLIAYHPPQARGTR